MKIYLAGKVSHRDWRHDIVGFNLRSADGNGDWFSERLSFGDGHIYTGPFFVGCDHGCSHFMGEHGVTPEMCQPAYGLDHCHPNYNDVVVCGGARRPWDITASQDWREEYQTGSDGFNEMRAAVIHKCREAIADSDMVFAWLDDSTAHGTLWELGYASGIGIHTAIGLPLNWDASDLWFPIYGAGQVYRAATPGEALDRSVAKVDTKELFLKCGSPIERQLLTELLRQRNADVTIVPQYSELGYRLDFAVFAGGTRVDVECDGHAYHERTKEQAKHDRSRDRALQAAGWIVCRFTGSEIHGDAARCASEALAFLERPVAAE